MSLSSWVFANIQGPEAKLQVTVYSKQVQVSGGQGLVVNAKMEASFCWTFPFWEMELKWAAIALYFVIVFSFLRADDCQL